jgi:hypothetical protein
MAAVRRSRKLQGRRVRLSETDECEWLVVWDEMVMLSVE